MTSDTKELSRLLTAPFAAADVKFKPISVRGNRALAAAYVDARAIMRRLDEVIGLGNWKDRFEVIQGNAVIFTLSVRVDGEWVERSDIGSPSEQPDEADRLKAAVSDGLKRCAVKLGIGRYLHKIASQWVEFDPQKKQFIELPKLPAWALPAPAKKTTEAGTALTNGQTAGVA